MLQIMHRVYLPSHKLAYARILSMKRVIRQLHIPYTLTVIQTCQAVFCEQRTSGDEYGGHV